jgi:hypothetical protein
MVRVRELGWYMTAIRSQTAHLLEVELGWTDPRRRVGRQQAVLAEHEQVHAVDARGREHEQDQQRRHQPALREGVRHAQAAGAHVALDDVDVPGEEWSGQFRDSW